MNRKVVFYTDLSDKDLVVYLRKGVEPAFAEIYNRYNVVLFLHARKMLGDEEQAKDVVQEVFTTLWSKKEKLHILSLKSYLYTSIKNGVLNLLLHEKHVQKHMQQMLEVYNAGSLETEQVVLERELAKLIEAEIQTLPVRMREAFVLSRKEHLSAEEIADRMHISKGTVKKQIGYALRILKMKFKTMALLLSYLS